MQSLHRKVRHPKTFQNLLITCQTCLLLKSHPFKRNIKCSFSQHDICVHNNVLDPRQSKRGKGWNHWLSLGNHPKLLCNFMHSAHVNGQEQNKDTFGLIQINMDLVPCLHLHLDNVPSSSINNHLSWIKSVSLNMLFSKAGMTKDPDLKTNWTCSFGFVSLSHNLCLCLRALNHFSAPLSLAFCSVYSSAQPRPRLRHQNIQEPVEKHFVRCNCSTNTGQSAALYIRAVANRPWHGE